jgi:germination protein M
MLKKYIAAVLAVVMLLCIFAACAPKKEDVYEEIPAAASAETMRNTVLYYTDDYGLVVPVMKQIKWVEGIGAAAVTELKANPNTDSEMETLGLNPILAEDAKVSLSIKDGLATLKLSKGAITGSDAVDEMCKVVAVVNTLTEFTSIQQVKIMQTGVDKKLSKGTDISKAFARFDLNVMTTLSDKDLKNASKVMLYFQEEKGEAIVPVTKYIGGKADPFAVMSELVKGPGCHGLVNLMPDGTKLLGIDIDKEGVASINFSNEFSGVNKEPDKEARLIKCISFSLRQFDNIKDVRILVNGSEYKSASQATMSYKYVNTIK